MQNPISIIWVPELNPDFSSFRRFMTRVNTSFNSINDFILNALIKVSNDIWCQFKSGVCKSSWRNRLARSTVNREVVGSIPTEDAF